LLCDTNATRHRDYCRRCKTFIVLIVKNGVRTVSAVDRARWNAVQSRQRPATPPAAPWPDRVTDDDEEANP